MSLINSCQKQHNSDLLSQVIATILSIRELKGAEMVCLSTHFNIMMRKKARLERQINKVATKMKQMTGRLLSLLYGEIETLSEIDDLHIYGLVYRPKCYKRERTFTNQICLLLSQSLSLSSIQFFILIELKQAQSQGKPEPSSSIEL